MLVVGQNLGDGNRAFGTSEYLGQYLVTILSNELLTTMKTIDDVRRFTVHWLCIFVTIVINCDHS